MFYVGLIYVLPITVDAYMCEGTYYNAIYVQVKYVCFDQTRQNDFFLNFKI